METIKANCADEDGDVKAASIPPSPMAKKDEADEHTEKKKPAAKPKPDPSLNLDPKLFELTEEEKEFALNVRDSIEGLPDLENLSDFMCVHLSLMGDVDWACTRAYQMQLVREEYDIRLTYEDGVKALTDIVNLHPLMFLSYSFNLELAKSELVLDSTRALMETLRDPRKMAASIKGGFYVLYATHPSLEIVRKGKTDIFECMGYEYGKGICNMDTMAHYTSMTVGTFPSHVITKFYHTPVMANVFLSMTKKLIPKEVGSYWEVGCRFAGGRLDKFYLLPTPEAARKRVLADLCRALRIRLESEKTFSLDDCQVKEAPAI